MLTTNKLNSIYPHKHVTLYKDIQHILCISSLLSRADGNITYLAILKMIFRYTCKLHKVYLQPLHSMQNCLFLSVQDLLFIILSKQSKILLNLFNPKSVQLQHLNKTIKFSLLLQININKEIVTN